MYMYRVRVCLLSSDIQEIEFDETENSLQNQLEKCNNDYMMQSMFSYNH